MQKAVGKSLEELAEVMKKLLSPQGCPWDREQTHHTLGKYLIEECYEAVEAIKNEDMTQLKEELGDVLLQVVFHSALAEREGCFDLEQVISGVGNKMISRHPHVFASMSLNTSQEVLANWEDFKKAEGKDRLLQGVPVILPALLRAYRIQEKVARVGFDFQNVNNALEKLLEETDEFVAAENEEELRLELGDMLFSLVNIARLKGLDPEAALQASNDKFTGRFNFVEEKVLAEGRSFNDYAIEELNDFWEKAKETDNNY